MLTGTKPNQTKEQVIFVLSVKLMIQMNIDYYTFVQIHQAKIQSKIINFETQQHWFFILRY